MNTVIEGKRLYLRPLNEADASEVYVGWLNDPTVNQYTESRYAIATIESVCEFIRVCNSNDHVYFFGIFELSNSRHVGNIKLGPTNPHHLFGDIGLIIGEKNCWGLGYATEAISLISNFAFEALKLHKLTASMYSENIGSYKAFIKAGFSQEGLLKSHFLTAGHYSDTILLGKINLS